MASLNVEFGQWKQFMDMSVREAFGKLPLDLDNLLKDYKCTPEDVAPLSKPAFQQINREAKQLADSSVASFRPQTPSHGPRHFREVRENFLDMFDSFYGSKARTDYLFVRQMAEILTYCHDCNHRGYTLRADGQKAGLKLYQPRRGLDVAVEWLTAEDVIAFGKRKGLPTLKLTFMALGILATVYGGAEAMQRHGQRNIPAFTAKHPISVMMRVADVRPPKDFARAIENGININFIEVPSTGVRMTSYDQLIEGQLGFYKHYVEDMLNALEKACGVDIAEKLGWRGYNRSLIRAFEDVKANPNSSNARYAREELRKIGVHE